jgi:hypothetical protein
MATLPVIAAIAMVALTGCTNATASPRQAPDTCVELGDEIVQLAWSQTGAWVAVGMIRPDGTPGARLLRSDGSMAADAVRTSDMDASTVVVSADGRLSWVAEGAGGRTLVEDRPEGRTMTPLPDGVTGIGWTAVGYALLQRQPDGGSRVLLLDVDRPAEPTVMHETERAVERLWISADPEVMLLTIVHPDHRDLPPAFEVVGTDATNHLEPPGADTSGASMPSLRRFVVYRSSISGRMEAVRMSDPHAPPVVLSERAATRGMISDRGLLAVAAADAVGRLCLIDAAGLLP